MKNRKFTQLGFTPLSIYLALVCSLLSFSVDPANATSPTCYVAENGVLTDGSRCSGNVVIESGVTTIGQFPDGMGSFQNSGITSVTIPASVTTIMYGAFWDAANLTSVTFAPNSNLQSIGHFAFAGTQRLKSITLSSSLYLISSVAFSQSGIQYMIFEGAPPTINNYNGPGNLQDVPSSATAWVTSANFSNFNLVIPTILPNIRELTGSTPPPIILSPSNGSTLSGTVGVSFSQAVNFFGFGTPVLEVSSGNLPPGITLNESGQLVGTPTTTAPLITRTYSFSLRVVDGAQSHTVAISFEISPPAQPEIESETYALNVGIPANKGFFSFAQGAKTITLVEGSLPPGISLSSGNRFVGTPTNAGTYSVKLRVTDSYSQSVTSDNFTFQVGSAVSANISASLSSMNPTGADEDPIYSVITTNVPDDFMICGFYKNAALASDYQSGNCGPKQWSYFISEGISSDTSEDPFENMTWVIRTYGPDASEEGDPDINTPYLATVTVNVSSLEPTITIGTSDFSTTSATNLGISLANFDQTKSYQVTVKFVNATTNVDVTNGTLSAIRGSTFLISGYTSYSASKLGFKGSFAAITSALSSITWRPATAAENVSIRIGISTAPGVNEFYDANSGHYYRLIATGTPWSDARTTAEATTLFGLQGYLAEVNSAAENAFIANETSASNVWIGAAEDADTAKSPGGFTGNSYTGALGQRWIWNGAAQNPLPIGTGEIAQGPNAAYSSWSGGEPNNDRKPGADCAVTNWRGAKGLWNDLPCTNRNPYLIEFGGRTGETSTALSSTLTTTVNAVAPVQYTITYNPDSGNTTPTQASLTTGQTFILANAITRSNDGSTAYQFAGWSSNGILYKAGETITVATSNLTFTAVWVQLYEVTYVVNGGTFSGIETVNDAECTSSSKRCTINQVIQLNAAPTRSGYDFAGWKDQAGASIVDSNNLVDGIQTAVTTSNYIFTASWTPITYTVEYVSSGSTAPTQSALRQGQSFTVGAAVTKAGFEFDGWKTGVFTYLPDSQITVGTSNITLTAQWTAVFSVTYSQGLGSGTPSSATAFYPESYELILDSDEGISRSGFTFGGWNDGSAAYQPGDTYTVGTRNITLTAQWSANSVSSPPQAPDPTPTSTTSTTPNPILSNNTQPSAQMLKMHTVYMASGSFALSNSTKRSLKTLAIQINSSGKKVVLAYGYTDNRGGVNNTRLSQQRAQAVAKFLRPMLKGKTIQIGWFGSRKPVATGNSASDLAMNRRVEIWVK